MRASQFIFEYNRDHTAKSLSSRFLAAAEKDFTLGPIPKGNELQVANFILNKLEKGDPTPNKKYTLWIARMYSLGSLQYEDVISSLKDTLTKFISLKNKNKLNSVQANILNYKSPTELYNTVSSLYKNIPLIDKGRYLELKTIQGDDARIIVPKDETAAKYYGQGTKWCTSARNSNQFNDYLQDAKKYKPESLSRYKSPFFIIIPKNPLYQGEKYQLYTGPKIQFMNDSDTPGYEKRRVKISLPKDVALDYLKNTRDRGHTYIDRVWKENNEYVTVVNSLSFNELVEIYPSIQRLFLTLFKNDKELKEWYEKKMEKNFSSGDLDSLYEVMKTYNLSPKDIKII